MTRSYSYQPIYTIATYCPWLDDAAFLDAYDRLVGYKNLSGERVQPHRYSPAMPVTGDTEAWAEPASFTLLDVSRAYSL